MKSLFESHEVVVTLCVFLSFGQALNLLEGNNNQTSLAEKKFLEEVSLDINNLSVGSESPDNLSNFVSFAVVKEVVQGIQNGLFIFVGKFFSELFNGVHVSPSLESITDVGTHVLEQLNQGFLFKLVFFGIEEAAVGCRLDGLS